MADCHPSDTGAAASRSRLRFDRGKACRAGERGEERRDFASGCPASCLQRISLLAISALDRNGRLSFL